LQPILPKSQSWLVDGDSKFVLQIRRPSYWRIEVPNKNAEEKTRVEELKEVLSKVLLFEKTPCPFKRDFEIKLPEAPQTPIKKRPWKPVEKQQTGRFPSPESKYQEDKPYMSKSPVQLVTEPAIGGNITSVPAKSPFESPNLLSDLGSNIPVAYHSTDAQFLDNPVDGNITPEEENVFPPSISSGVAPSVTPEGTIAVTGNDVAQEEESDNFSDATDDTNITPRSYFQPKFQPMIFEADSDTRPPAMQNCSRSITAPPILSLVTSPPSKYRAKSPLRRSAIPESESDFSSSVDSFHSVQSWHSPLDPPSPQDSAPSSPHTYPYPHNDIVLPKRAHTRDISELTVTPETPETPGVWKSAPSSESDSRSLSPPPKTPTLVNDASGKSDDEEERPEAITPPTVRPHFRHRATTSNNSRRRELSPLPAAVNLFSPPARRRSRRLRTAKHIPTAIIQTTCKILLSPPSHLLHLMLNIASKIAAGEWRGFLSNQGENVYWDFEQEYSAGNWNEDDYGMSLPAKPTLKKSPVANSSDTGGSWEVD